MKKLIVSIISFLRARTKAVVILMTLVGLFGLSQLAMAEDPVYFADANLKAAVESALGISDPTPTDMLSLTNLNANDRGIVDLTGIEHATNLTYLWLYYNQISDISALSGLTNLTILYLFSNQISNISALSRLTNLTDLGMSNNQISDISALSGLTNLTSLRLDYNQISDISALSGLTNLTNLYLFSNQISNISALSGLTNLTDLGLSNNQISDISALSGLTNLTNLTDLRLDDNQQSVTPQQQIINLFHSTWGGTFKNKWYGISTVQNPLDVWITQEIMFETKPDVVVECGTYHGGSAILWATILKNIVPDARIITIDIKDVRDPAAKVHPLAVESVDFLLGSSTDPKIVAEVKRRVKGKKVLLILDSLHTRDHVLDELNSYWDIVEVESYILVQDTVHPKGHMTGPGKAVKDFLAINKNFKIDQTRERFGLTNNRNGFLKRVQ